MSEENCKKHHLPEDKLRECIALLVKNSHTQIKSLDDTFKEENICKSDFISIIISYATTMASAVLIHLDTIKGENTEDVFDRMMRTIGEAIGIEVEKVASEEINRGKPRDEKHMH